MSPSCSTTSLQVVSSFAKQGSRSTTNDRRWFALTLAFVALLAPVTAVHAQQSTPERWAATIAPFVDSETVAVARVDLSRVDLAAVVEIFVETMQPPRETLAEIGGAQLVAQSLIRDLQRAGCDELYGLMSLSDLSGGPFFIAPVREGGNARAVAGLLFSGDADGPTKRPPTRPTTPAEALFGFEVCESIGDVVFAGRAATLERLRVARPVHRPDLTAVFAAVEDSTLQLALVVHEDYRRAAREMLPPLPPEAGGAHLGQLADQILWLAFGVELAPEVDMRLILKTQSADSAAALRQASESITAAVRSTLGGREAMPGLDAILDVFEPKVHGDQIEIGISTADGSLDRLNVALSPAIDAARGAAARSHCSNNLKSLALSMHNYHDTYKHFPAAASYDEQGQPLLSWRVQMLPYLDQQALYERFHLDEPWDSEHNRSLIAEMPGVFACPDVDLTAEGRTTYVVPIGKGTVFERLQGTKISEIRDGTSNTIMLVETDKEHAVIWTKPEELPFDPAQPIRGFGRQHGDVFNAACCDGSVRAISLEIDPDVVRRLMQYADGEAVPAF